MLLARVAAATAIPVRYRGGQSDPADDWVVADTGPGLDGLGEP